MASKYGGWLPVNTFHTCWFFNAHIPLTPFSVPNPGISGLLTANRHADLQPQSRHGRYH
jgi:hypothetical protein